MDLTPINENTVAVALSAAAARAARQALYARPVTDWSDADLVAELVARYAPSAIPPCPVCGGALSLESTGGGEPDRWACSIWEPDPVREGHNRIKAGRGETGRSGEFGVSGHYARSQYIDQRHGGDAQVMDLLRRFKAVEEAHEGLRQRERQARGLLQALVAVAPARARSVNAAASYLAAYSEQEGSTR